MYLHRQTGAGMQREGDVMKELLLLFEQTENCMKKLREEIRSLEVMYPSDEEDVVSCSLRMEEELAELRRNTVRMKVLLYGMLQNMSQAV